MLGRNGAGKSTTFRSIVGLVAERSGRIVFEGKDVSSEPTHAIVRNGLGYVPEERRIFTDLTVEENLEVGRQPKRSERTVLGRGTNCSRCFQISARCATVRADA